VKHIHLAAIAVAACLAGAGETYAAANDSIDRSDPYAQPGYGQGYGGQGRGYGGQPRQGQGYVPPRQQGYQQQYQQPYQQPRYAAPPRYEPQYQRPRYEQRYAEPEYLPPRPSYRQGRYASTCVTSRGACPARPAPPNSPCGCEIPGFGYKRGATTY
jgi:hypothetical protein